MTDIPVVNDQCLKSYSSWTEIILYDENMNRNCLDVDDVVKAGPGLSFIAYPEAIGLLPVCQLFSGMIFHALYYTV